ncbi:MAG: hypothetical protein AAF741_18800 [Bacteroidota bacterium]
MQAILDELRSELSSWGITQRDVAEECRRQRLNKGQGYNDVYVRAVLSGKQHNPIIIEAAVNLLTRRVDQRELYRPDLEEVHGAKIRHISGMRIAIEETTPAA